MNNLLKHALAVFGLVGTMVALINLQACQNEEQPIAKAEDTETYTTNESSEYKELGDYLDSVSIAYGIDAHIADEVYSEEIDNSDSLEYDEETLDVVLTTEGDAIYSEVIKIEASTFGEAFASARYQLGPNQEWVWEANGVTYTTNFAEEENTGATHTPAHFWTDAEINSGVVVDTTQAPY